MNRKKQYVLTVAAFALIAALVAAAFVVPEAVGGWYDSRTLGKAAYADMVYEPYQIYYYDSFPEKLCAVGDYLGMGFELYPAELNERGEKMSDEQLLSIVNEELSRMSEIGLLPQNLQAQTITTRRMMELYAVVDAKTEQQIYPNNIRYWWLNCEIAHGEVTVAVDAEYHRLYGVHLSADAELWKKMEDWEGALSQMKKSDITACWASYWGIGADMLMPEDAASANSNMADSYSSDGNDAVWENYGKKQFFSVYCPISLKSGASLNVGMNLYLNGIEGYDAFCGIQTFFYY